MEVTVTASDAASAGHGGLAPAVSIVVPCYNGGRFLDSLMASLARQIFRDFEIVIVDDGSTNGETLRKLAALEGEAHVIHQANGGPSAARNAGIRAARADILFMLDCDDTIEPGFLAETVLLMRDAPADVGMAYTHVRMVGADTAVVPRYFNRFDLLFTNTLSAGLVFRRESWLKAGGYDEAMRDGYEDWDFSLRLARAGYRGIEVKKPLYLYHIRNDVALPSRSSGIDRNLLYGPLWRYIRQQHAESYTLRSILRLWRETRDGSGRVPLWKGLAAYGLALVLPDVVFNQLIARLHRRRPQPGPNAAYSGAGGQPRLAP